MADQKLSALTEYEGAASDEDLLYFVRGGVSYAIQRGNVVRDISQYPDHPGLVDVDDLVNVQCDGVNYSVHVDRVTGDAYGDCFENNMPTGSAIVCTVADTFYPWTTGAANGFKNMSYDSTFNAILLASPFVGRSFVSAYVSADWGAAGNRVGLAVDHDVAGATITVFHANLYVRLLG